MAPMVVGVGGTLYSDSLSSRALTRALATVDRYGARSCVLSGNDLVMPPYDPRSSQRDARATTFVHTIRNADAVILAAPCYHGAMPGLIKNAIDYLEDLRCDARPYLGGRAIGVIACGGGAQGAGSVLAELRSIAHALRGTPVSLGVAMSEDIDAKACAQIDLMAAQLVELATLCTSPRIREAGAASSAA